LDFTGGTPAPLSQTDASPTEPRAQKNLSFNPAFAQVWVEIASV
jgi:hypothetical protein